MLDVKCWRTDYVTLDAKDEEEARFLAIKYWHDDPGEENDVELKVGEEEPDCKESPDIVEVERI